MGFLKKWSILKVKIFNLFLDIIYSVKKNTSIQDLKENIIFLTGIKKNNTKLDKYSFSVTTKNPNATKSTFDSLIKDSIKLNEKNTLNLNLIPKTPDNHLIKREKINNRMYMSTPVNKRPITLVNDESKNTDYYHKSNSKEKKSFYSKAKTNKFKTAIDLFDLKENNITNLDKLINFQNNKNSKEIEENRLPQDFVFLSKNMNTYKHRKMKFSPIRQDEKSNNFFRSSFSKFNPYTVSNKKNSINNSGNISNINIKNFSSAYNYNENSLMDSIQIHSNKDLNILDNLEVKDQIFEKNYMFSDTNKNYNTDRNPTLFPFLKKIKILPSKDRITLSNQKKEKHRSINSNLLEQIKVDFYKNIVVNNEFGYYEKLKDTKQGIIKTNIFSSKDKIKFVNSRKENN